MVDVTAQAQETMRRIAFCGDRRRIAAFSLMATTAQPAEVVALLEKPWPEVAEALDRYAADVERANELLADLPWRELAPGEQIRLDAGMPMPPLPEGG